MKKAFRSVKILNAQSQPSARRLRFVLSVPDLSSGCNTLQRVTDTPLGKSL